MTINEIQNQIIADMAAFEEWFDKYGCLVEQGKNLGPLSAIHDWENGKQHR
jgi:sulfur transfer protein SufE